MTLRALIAPQQFKGTLSALQAAEAIARGIRAAQPDAELDLAPLADGGEGTVEAMVLSQAHGQARRCEVKGALGQPLEAQWGYLPDDRKGPLGVIEMAAASGLNRIDVEQRSVLDAHTLGVGQLVRAALEAGCERVAVGAGDSGTCDGGMGAAVALGARFLDARGVPIALGPRQLERLERIDVTGLETRLKNVTLQVLADVVNPLLGEYGTARVYGPQKGADPDEIDFLEAALQHLARVVRRELGIDIEAEPGTGAAGGLAYGLATLCGAKIRRGFDAVSEALGLFQRVGEVDVVVTGEGQLDSQSAFAKGAWSLARLARMQRRRVVAFAGAVTDPAGTAREAFDEVIQVTPRGEGIPGAAEAEKLLTEAARQWALGFRGPSASRRPSDR